MMPAGVAAAQARISVIESRFAPTARVQEAAGIDFERMLATARTSSTTASTALGATAAMGDAGAPAELAGYGNGTIPSSALVPIGQGSHRLWAPAAAQFQAMEAAAARDGVALRVTDSYRTLDAQHELAERKGLYSQGGLAATPGTSNHGWGRSLDVDTNGGALEWLRTNGAQFGFHEDVPGEPWHWTFRPAT